MERKDIQFGVEKVQHTWYFHFDASTGMKMKVPCVLILMQVQAWLKV